VDLIGRKPDLGFAYGRFRFIDEHGQPLPFDPPSDNPDTYAGLFGGNHVAMCATAIFPRIVFERIGGFREQLRASEDYDLYFRVARLLPYRRHDVMVAECRRHTGNMSSNARLMLASTLDVVHSQKPFAGGPELRSAYARSVRLWQEYYGGALLRQIRSEVRTHDYPSALQSTACLLSLAPGVLMRKSLKQVVPPGLKGPLRRVRNTVRRLLSGPERRLTPLSRDFGYDRGTPIDRHYIEQFLNERAEDIRGHVLEVKDDHYTRTFGGSRVTKSDVLDIDLNNPGATVIADLAGGTGIPSDAFDCVILTQTLQLIYDLEAAVETIHRILRPGGAVLCTVPGITQMATDKLGRWSDHWRLTPNSAIRLFGRAFGEDNVCVKTVGNLAAAIGFLQGKATRELSARELATHDPDYPLLILIRAVRALV
jgi:SAM-dependent methyltransferase